MAGQEVHVVHGGLEARMAADLLNGFVVHSIRQHQRRRRVPQIVEADPSSSPSLHVHFEPSVREGVVIDGSPFFAREDRMVGLGSSLADELS